MIGIRREKASMTLEKFLFAQVARSSRLKEEEPRLEAFIFAIIKTSLASVLLYSGKESPLFGKSHLPMRHVA